MKKRFFIFTFLLIPGLIQLVLIQFSFTYFNIDNVSLLSRFKMFTNFSSDLRRQTLVLIKKEGDLPTECQKWDQFDGRKYNSAVFELERYRRNRADLSSKYEQVYERFASCYDVEIREVVLNKVDYQLGDFIKEERVVWKSKRD